MALEKAELEKKELAKRLAEAKAKAAKLEAELKRQEEAEAAEARAEALAEKARKAKEEADKKADEAAWEKKIGGEGGLCEGTTKDQCMRRKWWVKTSAKWYDKLTDLLSDLD